MTLLEKLKRMEEIEREPVLTRELVKEYCDLSLFLEDEINPILVKALECAKKISEQDDMDLEAELVARTLLYVMDTGKQLKGK